MEVYLQLLNHIDPPTHAGHHCTYNTCNGVVHRVNEAGWLDRFLRLVINDGAMLLPMLVIRVKNTVKEEFTDLPNLM